MLIDLTEATQQIQAGKVIAYPTEAVYGLGCDPLNKAAFHQLLVLKERPLAKGVILVAANIKQISPFAQLLDQPWTEQVLASWQAGKPPITWVLPATEATPPWLTGYRNTLAVRITHHPEVQALCQALNSAIVSTSANKNQSPPAKTLEACLDYFENIDILKGTLSGLEKPTEIWDARTLRQLR